MATKSFKKSEEQESKDTGTTELSETAPAELAERPMSHGEVEGEVDASDVRTPRINVVNPLSETAGKFDVGDLLLDKAVRLAPTKVPVQVVVLSIAKCYQQKLPHDSPEVPEIYKTAKEVVDNGGNFEWGSDNFFVERADINMLVEVLPDAALSARDDASKDMSEEERKSAAQDYGMFEIGGKRFAPAVLTVTVTAYTAAARPIFTAYAGPLKRDLSSGRFKLTSTHNQKGKNQWYTPSFALAGKWSEAEAAEIAAIKSELFI